MHRPRKNLWPAALGPNTPHDRARAVARAFRALAVRHAPACPALAADLAVLDRTAHVVGEASWLMPVLTTGSQSMSRDDVARLGGVTADAVSQWASVGLRRCRRSRSCASEPCGMEHRVLPRRDGGYDRAEVEAFLLWRDETKPHRPRRANPARVPPCPQITNTVRPSTRGDATWTTPPDRS